jgi:hypothetical protein
LINSLLVSYSRKHRVNTLAFLLTLATQTVPLVLHSTELIRIPINPLYVLRAAPARSQVILCFSQIIFGTASGTIWVLDASSYVTASSDVGTPIWVWVIICISCFLGGVVISAMVVCISRRLRPSSADSMKKPLLSHHDAL